LYRGLAFYNAQLNCAAHAALLSVGFLSSLPACLPAMARLAQQQLSSSAARASSLMPLTHLLSSVIQLLCCWHDVVEQVPAFLQVVVRTLLPLVQQLQGCSSLLVRPVAAAAASTPSVQAGSSSSSSSCEHQLSRVLFGMQQAASMLLNSIGGHDQVDAGVSAQVLRLQSDPAVAEMQLQLLSTWTAQLHKHHTAQQQQQLSQGRAGASSSSSQQQQQQSVKQHHRADLLSIPAFHQDMLQLLPGGQAYLDAAAEEAAGWGLSGEANAVQLHTIASNYCHSINHYLNRHFESIAGQQQFSKNALLSTAAVPLMLELQLLASGAVQRQREQHRQQQQQQQQQRRRQQALTQEDLAITDQLALQSWHVLGGQIKLLVAASRSCLPLEMLQQAGLQLLQALAAPLQQWQLSRTGDSFLRTAAAAGVLSLFGDTLHVLVTGACGAQPTQSREPDGKFDQHSSCVCLLQPRLLRLCISHGIQRPCMCTKVEVIDIISVCDMYNEVRVLRTAKIVCGSLLICCVFSACRAATWPAAQPSSSTPRGLHSPDRLLPAHSNAAS
jgi:hypothetical protein